MKKTSTGRILCVLRKLRNAPPPPSRRRELLRRILRAREHFRAEKMPDSPEKNGFPSGASLNISTAPRRPTNVVCLGGSGQLGPSGLVARPTIFFIDRYVRVTPLFSGQKSHFFLLYEES